MRARTPGSHLHPFRIWASPATASPVRHRTTKAPCSHSPAPDRSRRIARSAGRTGPSLAWIWQSRPSGGGLSELLRSLPADRQIRRPNWPLIGLDLAIQAERPRALGTSQIAPGGSPDPPAELAGPHSLHHLISPDHPIQAKRRRPLVATPPLQIAPGGSPDPPAELAGPHSLHHLISPDHPIQAERRRPLVATPPLQIAPGGSPDPPAELAGSRPLRHLISPDYPIQAEQPRRHGLFNLFLTLTHLLFISVV